MEEKRIPWKVGKWFKWKNYEITKGIFGGSYKKIYPTSEIDNKLVLFSPFDYFNEACPDAEEIFNLQKPLYFPSKYIHTLFTSLHNADEAYSWVRRFGFPFIPKDIGGRERLNIDVSKNFVEMVNLGNLEETVIACKEILVDDILKEASLMRWTVELHGALSEYSTSKLQREIKIPEINEIIYEALYFHVLTNGLDLSDIGWTESGLEEFNKRLAFEGNNKDIFKIMQSLIQRIFNLMLQNCSFIPTYQENENGAEPVWEWKFDSLLSAMYLMIFTDIMGGIIRQCARDECKIYFATSKIKQKFCSQYCQERAKKNRFNEKPDAKYNKSIYNKNYYEKGK